MAKTKEKKPDTMPAPYAFYTTIHEDQIESALNKYYESGYRVTQMTTVVRGTVRQWSFVLAHYGY